MSYQEKVQAARRQAILLALYLAPGYTMPRGLLRDQVEATGYVMSADLASTEIAWLTEQGFIEPLELDAVRLTARGEDIALGRSQNPGVRRPSPGEINGPR